MSRSKTIIEQLEDQAKIEGFEEGTNPFDRRIRQLKVIKCREMRGHTTCRECQAFDYCELTKQVMRDHRGY